ncbi:restriction endonuclease subunit S [Clostridium sp. HCP1S3_B4]|uniref:restriction endonuclease subunit S n=1 Tax=unclassified Clostridium TaxID=2614128 RepID=UPI003F8A5330
MNKNKKNVPNIRFPGFTEPWEQRKLGELGNTYSGLSGKTKGDFGHGKAQFVTYMNVFSNPIAKKEMVEPIEIDETQHKVLYGDVLFTTSSETPEEVGMSSVWLENTCNTYLNSFCFGYRPTSKIDSHFIAYVLRSDSIRKKIIFLAQGISRYNISKNKMMEIQIPIPKLSEQVKLGKYFTKFDNLITLHQRKLDHLKEQKKGLLQKMFPKKGEKVPEIRFPGFTEPWEQRKLGDEAIEIIAGGDIDKGKALDNGKYPIYANALTNDGIVGFYNDFYRVKAPAVTVTGRGEVGHAKARMIDFTPVVRLLSVRSNHDSYFLENAINNHNVIVESTGVPQLTVPQLANYNICFPKKIEEEIKIGAFFNKLDNLISLQQRKIDHLKEQKKGLLQQMFV